MKKLTLIGVEKTFSTTLYENLNLEVSEGQRLALTGVSGSGKTTLLRMILGLEKPDAGQIINGFQKMSCVFQENRLLEERSAMENLSFVGCDSGENILRTFDISDLHTPVKYFSGGMKRRVALARAVAYGGDFLLLDEPFQGLDDALRRRCADLLASSFSTILVVTHDPEDCLALKTTREFHIELTSI